MFLAYRSKLGGKAVKFFYLQFTITPSVEHPFLWQLERSFEGQLCREFLYKVMRILLKLYLIMSRILYETQCRNDIRPTRVAKPANDCFVR